MGPFFTLYFMPIGRKITRHPDDGLAKTHLLTFGSAVALLERNSPHRLRPLVTQLRYQKSGGGFWLLHGFFDAVDGFVDAGAVGGEADADVVGAAELVTGDNHHFVIVHQVLREVVG